MQKNPEEIRRLAEKALGNPAVLRLQKREIQHCEIGHAAEPKHQHFEIRHAESPRKSSALRSDMQKNPRNPAF